MRPAAYLNKLLEVLQTGNICLQGTWDLGDAILGVCQSVLRCSDTESVRQPLGDTLLHMWRHYGDVDIRDQARFTYMLLTNVSGSYLRTVLEPTEVATLNRDVAANSYKEYLQLDAELEDEGHVRKESVLDTPHKLITVTKMAAAPYGHELLGGASANSAGTTTMAGGAAGAQASSASAVSMTGNTTMNVVAAGPGTTGTTTLGQDAQARLAATMSRRGSAAAVVSRQSSAPHVEVDAALLARLRSDNTVLRAYVAHLAAHLDAIRVQLNCLVSYEVAPGLARLIKPPARLYAVRLVFETDAEYEPIADIHVPRLCKPAYADSEAEPRASLRMSSVADSPLRETMDDESSHAVATLECCPRVPSPAVLRVRVEYTDSSGGSFRAAAEDLRLDFPDLFCDALFPPTWPASGGAAGAYRLALFEQLWHAIEARSGSETGGEVSPGSKREASTSSCVISY